jgi:hypothetical protein
MRSCGCLIPTAWYTQARMFSSDPARSRARQLSFATSEWEVLAGEIGVQVVGIRE